VPTALCMNVRGVRMYTAIKWSICQQNNDRILLLFINWWQPIPESVKQMRKVDENQFTSRVRPQFAPWQVAVSAASALSGTCRRRPRSAFVLTQCSELWTRPSDQLPCWHHTTNTSTHLAKIWCYSQNRIRLF